MQAEIPAAVSLLAVVHIDPVGNVPIYHEAPITYRNNVALEDAWHEKVGRVGLNHPIVPRLAEWYLRWCCGSDQAMRLEELLMTGVFGV